MANLGKLYTQALADCASKKRKSISTTTSLPASKAIKTSPYFASNSSKRPDPVVYSDSSDTSGSSSESDSESDSESPSTTKSQDLISLIVNNTPRWFSDCTICHGTGVSTVAIVSKGETIFVPKSNTCPQCIKRSSLPPPSAPKTPSDYYQMLQSYLRQNPSSTQTLAKSCNKFINSITIPSSFRVGDTVVIYKNDGSIEATDRISHIKQRATKYLSLTHNPRILYPVCLLAHVDPSTLNTELPPSIPSNVPSVINNDEQFMQIFRSCLFRQQQLSLRTQLTHPSRTTSSTSSTRDSKKAELHHKCLNFPHLSCVRVVDPRPKASLGVLYGVVVTKKMSRSDQYKLRVFVPSVKQTFRVSGSLLTHVTDPQQCAQLRTLYHNK